MEINNVVSSIKNAKLQKKPILIGIEGFGGSGKTTLSEKLKYELRSAYTVNIDDFIVKREA